MQDSRAYDVALPDKAFYKPGLDLEHNPYKDYLEPFDTYVEIKNLLGRGLSVKAGRQTIRYGDNRIFGPGQWGNTGRYIWDAVKLSYKFSKNFTDIFYGANIIHDPDSFSLNHRDFYEGLAFYSHFLLPLDSRKVYLEPFFASKWDKHKNYKSEDGLPGEFRSNFYGFRSYAELPYGLDYDFTFVWQRGNLGNDDIDAYAFHALGGYTFRKGDWTTRISAEFSYASGDDNPKDGERGTFGGVFGARDKMYGRMNLMHWKNLRDAQTNLQLNPSEKLSFKAELHKFWLAEAKDSWYFNQKMYRDMTGGSGRDLGMEFDIVGRYIAVLKGLEVQFGYGHFWPGKFVKKMADDVDADWYFMQIHYKFSRPLL